jgi:hypothetical protein
VLNRKILGLAGAFVVLMGVAQPALAQTPPPNQTGSSDRRTESDRASGTFTGTRVQPGRLNERDPAAGSPRQRPRGRPAPAAAAPTPEEIRAAAQAQLTAANLSCTLTEAANPGVIGESQVYEAACANAEGYILIASTPPQSFSCIELAGTAAIARSRDPNADVGQQCVMPANQNSLAIISGWAREAGATCTVDEAQAIGKSDENNMVYEVGCNGADGYWLEKTAAGWDLKDCLQVNTMNGSCRFTTAAEQAQGFQPKLAGTDAADCTVTQVRMMGQNANGRFYEAKCSAEGQGYIARVNNEGVTQQVYACATAQRIGGGCTLTPAPAAAPATGGRP